MSTEISLKQRFGNPELQEKFKEVLKSKSTGFIASVLATVNNNKLLQKADPVTVITASMMAATLDLPINPNLGFAYIVPYGKEAQFQLGYKGYIQLAMRSGQFQSINVTAVKEGEIKILDFLTGEHCFDWNQDYNKRIKLKTIGFVAYFKLINGATKSLYMSSEEIHQHATAYSSSFKRGSGVWKDNFEAMASKTVLKLLLSKYAPMSVDMQKAVISDQSVVKDVDSNDVTYPDNEDISEAEVIDEEVERTKDWLKTATKSQVEKNMESVKNPDVKALLNEHLKGLENAV